MLPSTSLFSIVTFLPPFMVLLMFATPVALNASALAPLNATAAKPSVATTLFEVCDNAPKTSLVSNPLLSTLFEFLTKIFAPLLNAFCPSPKEALFATNASFFSFVATFLPDFTRIKTP